MTRGSARIGTWLIDVPPTSRQSQSALAVTAVLLLAFGVLAPFAGTPLLRLNGFIPTIDAIVFVTDFVTSVLLFSQFSIYRSRALLALASVYLFTALIVMPHALSFPGAFPPTANLGGSIQTTFRLYLVWHLGFPIALLTYVWLNREIRKNIPIQLSTQSAICWSAASMLGLVCGFVWLAIAGDSFLPSLYVDPSKVSPVLPWVLPLTMLICLLALATLWAQQRSVLDQWLIVVSFASIVELALSAQFGNAPFSLGFYTGRIFSIVTATVILMVILVETTNLHAHLAYANAMLERERENRLMSAQAITAAIAHEIKQPLTAIAANGKATVALLEKTPPDLNEIREALNDIVDDSHRTSEVFDGIRTVVGKAGQELEMIDVNRIIFGVIESLEVELRGHGMLTRHELATALPLVNGHAGQLREVVFNLINNAVEAMVPTTSRSRVLRLKTELRGQDAMAVSVQDSGPGIDPERSDNMFEAFVTTKARGTGLGLAICRMIVERHGGRLTASSDGVSGALFQFILPIGSPLQRAISGKNGQN